MLERRKREDIGVVLIFVFRGFCLDSGILNINYFFDLARREMANQRGSFLYIAAVYLAFDLLLIFVQNHICAINHRFLHFRFGISINNYFFFSVLVFKVIVIFDCLQQLRSYLTHNYPLVANIQFNLFWFTIGITIELTVYRQFAVSQEFSFL